MKENGIKTVGKVIRVYSKEERDIDDMLQIYYYPVVEYKTPQGKTVVRRPDFGSTSKHKFTPEDEITIYYDKNNPEDIFEIDGLNAEPLLYLLSFIGMGCLAFSIYQFFK